MSAVLDAALALTRHYPGGAAALGARMGKTNLADEVNPNLPRSKLGLDDAVTMELLAHDYRILRAHALECRHFPPVPMPDGFDEEAEPCMQTLAKTAKEFADLVAVVSADAADGDVSDADLARARREVDDLQVMCTKLLGQLAALNEAAKRRGRGGE